MFHSDQDHSSERLFPLSPREFWPLHFRAELLFSLKALLEPLFVHFLPSCGRSIAFLVLSKEGIHFSHVLDIFFCPLASIRIYLLLDMVLPFLLI